MKNITHILSNLAEDYSELITVLESNLDDLTIQKLKERVRGFYRRKQRSENYIEKNTHALLHIFKGRCKICGMYGHKGVNCPKKRITVNGNNRDKKTTCRYCRKQGHIEEKCYEKKSDIKRKNDTSQSEEVALITANVLIPKNTEIWIGDTGATNHMTNNFDGMKNISQVMEQVKIGDGSTMLCSARGDLNIIHQQQNITLQDVMYIPKLQYNLLSLAQVTKRRNAVVKIHQNSITVCLKGKEVMKLQRKSGQTLYSTRVSRRIESSSACVSNSNVQFRRVYIIYIHCLVFIPYLTAISGTINPHNTSLISYSHNVSLPL